MPAPYPPPWRPSRLHPTRWLAVRLGGLPWLPRLAPYIVRVDLLLRRLTGGRITLLTFAGLPELFLTIAGRKTGQLRTTPLLCVPRYGSWLVAGSNWGGPKPPAWVGNLAAADIAKVGFHGRDTDVERDACSRGTSGRRRGGRCSRCGPTMRSTPSAPTGGSRFSD